MQIAELLRQLITIEDSAPAKHEVESIKPEMLTIKECAALVDGLSEHTVRQLVKQDKVAYIRTGAGRNGKILVARPRCLNILVSQIERKIQPCRGRQGEA